MVKSFCKSCFFLLKLLFIWPKFGNIVWVCWRSATFDKSFWKSCFFGRSYCLFGSLEILFGSVGDLLGYMEMGLIVKAFLFFYYGLQLGNELFLIVCNIPHNEVSIQMKL